MAILALSVSLDPCLPKKEHVSIATTTAEGLVLGVQEKVESNMYLTDVLDTTHV
jgi:hypothetical protein